MGVGLFVGVWIARYLGPEQYGLLNFSIAFTGLFGAIATLGLQGIVVRDIVRDPENAKLTLGTTAILQLIGGLISFLLILGAAAYLRSDDVTARSIIAILSAMMLFKASEITVYWFESQVQSKYTVWVQNSVFLIFAFIKVALIVQHASLSAFAWAIFAEAAVVALALVAVMGFKGPSLFTLKASIVRAKRLFKDSWPLILSGIAVTVYMKIDQIMLGQIMGDQAVGVYSAAARISEVWYFIPMAIVASVFPVILQARKYGAEMYEKRMQILYNSMTFISISVAIPASFFSESLIKTTYGDAYSEAAAILTIHIWGGIFVSLGFASGRWLIAEGYQKMSLQRTLLGAAANVILNAILIPVFGLHGAAWATVISYFIAGFLFDILQNNTRRMFFMKLSSLNIFYTLRWIYNFKQKRLQ